MQQQQAIPALVLLSAALVVSGATIGIIGLVIPLIRDPIETLSIFGALCLFVLGGAWLSYKFLHKRQDTRLS